MNNQRQTAKAIFLEAVENHSAEQWPKFLDEQCGDDRELRKLVEKLLEAHQQAASLFDADPADGEAVTMPPGNRQSAPSVIGPYKLLQQIGEGGMGAVWMAEQEKPVRRRVALKLIRPDMGSKEIIARFEAERQALAMMKLPNIARVLDAGTTETGSP